MLMLYLLLGQFFWKQLASEADEEEARRLLLMTDDRSEHGSRCDLAETSKLLHQARPTHGGIVTGALFVGILRPRPPHADHHLGSLLPHEALVDLPEVHVEHRDAVDEVDHVAAPQQPAHYRSAALFERRDDGRTEFLLENTQADRGGFEACSKQVLGSQHLPRLEETEVAASPELHPAARPHNLARHHKLHPSLQASAKSLPFQGAHARRLGLML
mmetsp:Transcript_88257/g.234679  ORF Transcript_88257/g.234679 Transcript_88257/m.234679 type:complete len:216 (-) Transcript_88257:323-970(-)